MGSGPSSTQNTFLMYSRSQGFTEELLVGSLSSIPRWRFARKLEGCGDEANVRRVPEAMDAFRESTVKILSGSNTIAEFLVNREDCAPRIKLKLYAALTRSLLYMERKDV